MTLAESTSDVIFSALILWAGENVVGRSNFNHEINKLALHLTSSNHKEIHLVFFHADAKNFIIGEEFRIAKKWLDIITSKI